MWSNLFKVQKWLKYILERHLYLEISILADGSVSSSWTSGISCSLQWWPLQWLSSTCSWPKYHQMVLAQWLGQWWLVCCKLMELGGPTTGLLAMELTNWKLAFCMDYRHGIVMVCPSCLKSWQFFCPFWRYRSTWECAGGRCIMNYVYLGFTGFQITLQDMFSVPQMTGILHEVHQSLYLMDLWY